MGEVACSAPSHHHHVGIAVLNQACSEADVVGSCGAGCDDRDVRDP